MLSRMDYLQNCFYKSTAWNEDNIFANILATSNALINFQVPNGSKVEVSLQSTPYLASFMSLLNYQSVNGSLAYLYLSIPLTNAIGTKDISLQDAIAGFRIIEPHFSPITSKNTKRQYTGASLLYGRMYFPGSALEAMIIKQITPHLQLLVKCINNENLYKNGTMIVYLQENTPRFSREYIYSTNESLIGFRCLYNFGLQNRNSVMATIPNFDNSVVSMGAELWYAALSMSPGLSTAVRYSTRSTSTGKPLTMTLSCNPILGHISSTYNVKTSVASTVSSKYDFNWFSYSSNLSLGIELYKFLKNLPFFSNTQNRNHRSIHHDTLAPPISSDPMTLASSVTNNTDTFGLTLLVALARLDVILKGPDAFLANSSGILTNSSGNLAKISGILTNSSGHPTKYSGILTNSSGHLIHSRHRAFLDHGNSRLTQHHDPAAHEVMTEFSNLVSQSNFSSVIKASASLNDQIVKLMWVGRWKDFLLSTGFKVNFKGATSAPEFSRFGITFSYGC